jgi:hypothetical protein
MCVCVSDEWQQLQLRGLWVLLHVSKVCVCVCVCVCVRVMSGSSCSCGGHGCCCT